MVTRLRLRQPVAAPAEGEFLAEDMMLFELLGVEPQDPLPAQLPAATPTGENITNEQAVSNQELQEFADFLDGCEWEEEV